MRDHHRQIIDFLRSQGAENITLEPRKKHPRIRFVWKGDAQFYVVPNSPGDTMRGAKNAIGDLRHILGLVQPTKRVGERRVRRSRAEKAAAECPTITAAPDWTQALQRHPHMGDVLRGRVEQAWLALWRDCMRAAGGESRL